MRLACHIIMQAQGAIDGPIESVRSPIHIVTPLQHPRTANGLSPGRAANGLSPDRPGWGYAW